MVIFIWKRWTKAPLAYQVGKVFERAGKRRVRAVGDVETLEALLREQHLDLKRNQKLVLNDERMSPRRGASLPAWSTPKLER